MTTHRHTLLSVHNASARGADRVRDVDELLTVDDVAALLKVSRSWVYEHTRSGRLAVEERLPHIKIGKYIRFDRQSVTAFLERCRTR